MPFIDQVSQLTGPQQNQLGRQQPSIKYRATTILVQAQDDQELATVLQDIKNALGNGVKVQTAKEAGITDLPRRIVVSKADGSALTDLPSTVVQLQANLGDKVSLEHLVGVDPVRDAYNPTGPPPLNGHAQVDQGAYTISKPPAT